MHTFTTNDRFNLIVILVTLHKYMYKTSNQSVHIDGLWGNGKRSPWCGCCNISSNIKQIVHNAGAHIACNKVDKTARLCTSTLPR